MDDVNSCNEVRDWSWLASFLICAANRPNLKAPQAKITGGETKLNRFCILDQSENYAVSRVKPAIGKGLGRLARDMHLEGSGVGEVESELSFKVAVCSIYESLLQRCMATFEVWASRRREICEARSRNEESGAELLRLQAEYTTSYNDLCKHVGRCEICKSSSFTYHGNGAKDSKLLYVRDLPTRTEAQAQ